MTKQNFSQRNKGLRKLFLKSNITFSNNPINRLIVAQSENDKEHLLKKLKDKISAISECKLKNNSNNIVFNDGNINSPIMLIGEAPGQKEDELSKPFVGEAGSLLNKMLSAINLYRKDLYVTNVVNYRPPLNRKPDSNEIERYSEFLLEHVDIIKPKIIILLGSTAMEAFFGSSLKISKERGIWKEILIKDKTFLTMVTYHPAYLLRKNDQKKYSWIDLKKIRNKIDELKIVI